MNKPNLHRLSEIHNETIFVLFLRLLRVKHTKKFANKLYEEHPYKNTLFGLYCLLKEYGIKGSGLRIHNKDELSLLSTPFIAYVSNSFGLVYRITEEKVNYINQGIDIQISQKEFKNIWDGVVLIAEPDDNSCEPEYKEHRKASYFSYIQKLLLFLVVITTLGVGIYLNPVSFTIGTIISLLLNITGIYNLFITVKTVAD